MNVIFKGSCGAYALLGVAPTPVMAPLVSTLLSSACASCQKRYKKTRRFSDREDDLIQEALDDEFGENNMCARGSYLVWRRFDEYQAGERISQQC